MVNLLPESRNLWDHMGQVLWNFFCIHGLSRNEGRKALRQMLFTTQSHHWHDGKDNRVHSPT